MNPRAWTDSASQQLHTLAPSLLSRTVYEQESSVGVLTALLTAASDGVVPWPSRKGCPPRSAGATEHVKREFQGADRGIREASRRRSQMLERNRSQETGCQGIRHHGPFWLVRTTTSADPPTEWRDLR